ncbi:MAG: BREX-1 system adenine-specific DNA-methyltransferase PglX [Flintibacter sp.]|uniref:BREX-1 system adenine-specific DNA-methyltransferase PglX n=1 Tax=Flintibacter sp. TaxID=1918624 RepID=UPI002673A923|nr:BREX-1 system adenine-specific DNA-methyltransferase PglX [Flintibacter sp.]MCI6150867.1 BREX-1 system adenine-specific DNA-methyltransferase PglX [Flintibacter sp.]MDY5038235.1 BREX-1 system adenine-specific DNA-methyltransferase PglX [Lawsonibacter sp.]
MNKSAIQKFAMWARTTLMEQVAQRAYQYGITKDGYGEENAVTVNGMALSSQEQSQRRELVREIQAKGYDQVVEEVAYTWFNRFIALRYMEVNNYLPSHIRVFSNAQGAFDPEILKEALHIDLPGLDQSKVAEYIEKNETEALYRYLLLTQCNALNEGLPKMFEKMGGYTELLFPNNILRPDSVLGRMVADIPEEDWTDQVQIIGWLYQYYNTELKTETFDLLKKNVKVTKERIPSATQLFTPDWIVRYMVENSLGRLWLEGHPNQALRESWKYYLDEAEQEPEVEAKLVVLRAQRQTLRPEDITLIDPCMGSGHILVYAFDVLMQIYESEGWSQRDAAAAIVQKNLYGLDIDRRAAQLAYFAVMMKARQYDRRFLTRGIQPNLYHPAAYAEGQEFGSLLIVDELEPKPEQPDEITLFDGNYGDKLNTWNFRSLLARQYDVVVTNPPYMAVSNGDAALNKYIKDNYPDSKGDLFAAFIERCGRFARQNGYQAMITQHSWMFLSSFEKLRTKLLQSTDIVDMAHLGARAFEEIGGEVVQTTSFVLCRAYTRGYKGTYCRLVEPTTQQGKENMFLEGNNRYVAEQANFSKIPGSPVAYWASRAILCCFENKEPLDTRYKMREGIHTADNDRFLKLWHEVSASSIVHNASSYEDIDKRGRWIPYNKGGAYRKWYGNNDWVIGFDLLYRNEMARLKGHVRPSESIYFLEGGTWTAVTMGGFGIRYYSSGYLFDAGGQVAVGPNIYSCIAYLNSKLFGEIAKLTMPTINYKCGVIKTLPNLCVNEDIVITVTKENISLSQQDWDSDETSWDFKRHPLV